MSKRTFKLRMWGIEISLGIGGALTAFAILYVLSLLPLQFTSKGAAASGCVLFGCILGAAFFTAPLLLALAGTYVFAVKKRLNEVAAVWGGTILYYALVCSLLIYVPRWDKIVVNTRDGYHDFQTQHQNEGREASYRQVEWVAEVTRPIWEWLANK